MVNSQWSMVNSQWSTFKSQKMSFLQFNLPFHGVVRHLIVINVLMFIGTYALLGGEVFDYETGDYITLGRMQLAAFLPGSAHFQPYQIVTHMFMHGDVAHLAFNMLAIYWFGSMVEMVWGAKRFLFFYFCLVQFPLYICSTKKT